MDNIVVDGEDYYYYYYYYYVNLGRYIAQEGKQIKNIAIWSRH